MARLTTSTPASSRADTDAAQWILCGLFIGLAVAVNQSAVHWRQNVVDSHLFAYFGWCVAHGARPYLDVWDNKPPGIWWLNAVGFRLCGAGVGGELLISSVGIAAALCAFVGLARLAVHRSLTLLAAVTGCVLLPHLTYEGGANRTETFVIACESVAVLTYLTWYRAAARHAPTGQTARHWPNLVLAGLVAGIAPLFKQSGLAAGAACSLHLAWTQFRTRRAGTAVGGWTPWLVLVSSAAIAPVCAAGALAAQGALAEAWRAVVTFNRAYFTVGDATWVQIGRALRTYSPVFGPLGWLLGTAGIGLAWPLATWLRGLLRNAAPQSPGPRSTTTSNESVFANQAVRLFWLWFLLAAYLACVGPGRRGHHFLPALPALGLLALYPLHRLVAARGLMAQMVARPTATALCVLFAYGLTQSGVTHARELARCWNEKPAWCALSYRTPPAYEKQAEAIRRLTSPDDAIYVWGWSPGTYRYALRRPASRFATLEKVGSLGADARFILDGALADLRARAPRLLAISDSDLEQISADRQSEIGPWLVEHYENRGEVGGMRLLLRRPPP